MSRPRIQAPDEPKEQKSFTLRLNKDTVDNELVNKRRLLYGNHEKSSNRIPIKSGQDESSKPANKIPIKFGQNESPPDKSAIPVIKYDESDESSYTSTEKSISKHSPIFFNNKTLLEEQKPSKRVPIKFDINESSSSTIKSNKRQPIRPVSDEKSPLPTKNSLPIKSTKHVPIVYDESSNKLSSRTKRRDRSESPDRRSSKRRRNDRSKSPEQRSKRGRRESPSFTRNLSRHSSTKSDRSSNNNSFFRSPATPNNRNRPFQQPPVYKGEDGRYYVAFFTNKYIFSNHFVCPSGVTVDGLRFPSTEHYYMYQKAVFHEDEKVANEIQQSDDPKYAKQIAGRLPGFDNEGWKKIQYKIMEKACLAKFQQNSVLRRELFRTCNAVLVEASPSDRRWGVGLTIDDEDVADESKWQGTNLLGKLLMNVRMRLATEFADEFEAEQADAQQELERRAIIC